MPTAQTTEPELLTLEQPKLPPFKSLLWMPVQHSDPDLYDFYKARGFAPIWSGPIGAERRAAFKQAILMATEYGLPPQIPSRVLDEYDQINPSHEIKISRMLIKFAQQAKYGALTPAQVDPEIKRTIPQLLAGDVLGPFISSPADEYFAALHPQTDEFARLLVEKRQIERHLKAHFTPPLVPETILRPGDNGDDVRLLRASLAMNGYAVDRFNPTYDEALTLLVSQIQSDHGLNPDGAFGPATAALFNLPLHEKWQAIMVALERARWNNRPKPPRYITVNLADFRMRVIKDGQIDFETRAVIGANLKTHRSPEFSDEMEYIVINPIWNVPRQITVDEYLPKFQEDPTAEPQLVLFTQEGEAVPRESVDFTTFDKRNFPFLLKELPSDSNALGVVKFLFPNPYNIYMHDTPSKSLFGRDKRDFSHGCIRLQRPEDFALYLMQDLSDDPKSMFDRLRAKPGESYLKLDPGIEVHLTYRTAVVEPGGRVTYRNDVYGRDAKIWAALERAGVAPNHGQTVQSVQLNAQND